MNAIATKFQVSAAALAVGVAAAFTPAVANAAPAVEAPAAPMQMVGGVAQAPGDLAWFFEVTSVQFAASRARSGTYWTDRSIARYEARLAIRPDSIFAPYYQRRIAALQLRRAQYGLLNMSACRDGQGVSAGPYGTFTRGAC